jgi:hypothetical protein
LNRRSNHGTYCDRKHVHVLQSDRYHIRNFSPRHKRHRKDVTHARNLPRHEQCVEYVRNVMAHAQKPEFVFRPNGRVHLNRQGRQFSRLLAGELCTSACRVLYCSCKPVFCSHVTLTGYPLHSPVSPSLLLPCVTVCHHNSTGFCLTLCRAHRETQTRWDSQLIRREYGSSSRCYKSEGSEVNK